MDEFGFKEGLEILVEYDEKTGANNQASDDLNKGGKEDFELAMKALVEERLSKFERKDDLGHDRSKKNIYKVLSLSDK